MPSSPAHTRFAHTHWSIAMQPDAEHPASAGEALVELCQRYWYPVYAYIRHRGHAPEIAQDITRNFLQHLFRHFREPGTADAQGRFGRYLLMRLHEFLAEDWRKTSDDAVVGEFAQPPADLERRNQSDNAGAGSPEQAYQQSFALEVLHRSLANLRKEARQTGHLDMYEALEPHLAREPVAGEYEEIARRLHSHPLALVVALKRLRQRLRELSDAELTDTVASAEELSAEQQALHAALRGRP